ncbi:PTS sugar transporter subunit IIA [Clostridium rectalis]|uniref:PTS sugar transporter subunit IIA n=1 Tax=Clostridium rectalis TaxID=2040295 RepID=UPI000F63030C|nr:PTS glucose transporter subunit IIA [Clostridium rectalis]
MLDFFKKTYAMIAPVSGKVINLSKVPDEVFANKLAGDGVAIECFDDVIVSPIEGTLSLIFKTNHAFGITTDNGAEVLVHIGIDTVKLSGKGFQRLTSEGNKVKVGEPIIKIDRQFIKEAGYSLITPVLVTNRDNLKDINYKTDIEVISGKDTIFTYKMK